MPLENWPKPVRDFLFWILGIRWAHRFLLGLSSDNPSKLELLNRIFQRNQFDVLVTGEDKIPAASGCVFATNHPHGLFDGLGAIWLGCKHGHDSRAIGRDFLAVFEPIKDWFLLVKVDADRKAQQGQQILEQSADFLKDGGSLVVTPAARVSVSRPLWRPARDLPWKSGVVRLHHNAEAPIVLVYIDVRHSLIRQLGQSIHGVVRALLQVWAYRFGRSQKLHMHVLDVIHPGQLPDGSIQEQTEWLQAHFERLASEHR